MTTDEDVVAIEAPLQIVLRYGPVSNRQLHALAITMRTPGDDAFLSMGYLFSEGVISSKKDVVQIRHLSDNEIVVELNHKVAVDLTNQQRLGYVNSGCGVCGKKSIESLKSLSPFILKPPAKMFKSDQILRWSSLMLDSQKVFNQSGGVHAAALFDGDRLIVLKEDVGRHNAMDKLIGFAISELDLPLDQVALVMSSRASFELVQKALMAGIPILASVGAPTSMAIDQAEENNLTLVGFLKEHNFNIYTHSSRLC